MTVDLNYGITVILSALAFSGAGWALRYLINRPRGDRR